MVRQAIRITAERRSTKIIDELNGSPQISQEAMQLIDYYESNKTRMNYPQYKKIGAGIIGSGAIESPQNRRTKKNETVWTEMESKRRSKYVESQSD
ncbi:MAG: hypothetical protein IPH58_00820 [Sphingobacteriales bacterium]|nr:hypothetical protein [Sphingobacteriales bacterium]